MPPSSQIYTLIYLLAPGFAALWAGIQIHGRQISLSNFEKYTLSVILGLAITSVVVVVPNNLSFQTLVNAPLSATRYSVIALYVGVTAGFSIAVAYAMRFRLGRRINKLFWGGSPSRYEPVEAWEKILDDAEGIIVESNGWRYYGSLLTHGVEGEKGSLAISCKERIFFDRTEQKEKGEGWHHIIFFPEGSIDNITVVTCKD